MPDLKARRVRIPVTLFVEEIDLHPSVDFKYEMVRTAYDLELSKEDIEKLYAYLGEYLRQVDDHPSGGKRIRVIGRLVSQ